MTLELTDRQSRIVVAIREFIAEHSYPPSHRDIMALTDISSTSVVAYNLSRLRDLGVIELPADHGRALRLLGDAASSFEIKVPLIGEMRLGLPLPSYTAEIRWPTINVAPPGIAAASAAVFALRVRGSGFEAASLSDGDIVLIDRVGGPLAREGTYAIWHPDRHETAIAEGRSIRPPLEIQARLRGMIRLW